MRYFQYLLEQKKIKHIEVRSAGVMTIPGLLATPETNQMLESFGVDLNKHRSVQLSKDMIKKADLILGMTPFHVQSSLRESDSAKGKTFLFKEYVKSDLKNYQINDPMGCTLEVYKKIFNEIKAACNKLLQVELARGKGVKRGRKKKDGAGDASSQSSSDSRAGGEDKKEDLAKLKEKAKSKLKSIIAKMQPAPAKSKAADAKEKEKTKKITKTPPKFVAGKKKR